MPSAGVASHFVDLLASDQLTARRRATTLAVVAAVLAIPAYAVAGAAGDGLLDPGRLAFLGLAAHALAVLAGLIAGNLVTRRRVLAYESSLRSTWKAWMRWSAACESVPEVHRRVTGARQRNVPWWTAALLTVLWALEVALLVLAFANEGSLAWALPVIALNGLIPAAFAAHFLRLKGWERDLQDSLADLVKEGELGVWGVL